MNTLACRFDCGPTALEAPCLAAAVSLTAPQEPGRHPEGQDWLFSNVREGKSELVLCSSWAYATLGVPAMIAISSGLCMQTSVLLKCFPVRNSVNDSQGKAGVGRHVWTAG